MKVIAIYVKPDFDVNMLAYDGILFNYSDSSYDIQTIIQNITAKVATRISPSSEREIKMINKEWIII